MTYRNFLITVGVLAFLIGGYLLFVPTLEYDSTGQLAEDVVGTYKGFDSAQIQPLPLTVSLAEDKVTLGRRLFNDPRLSHDNTISCATCHDLKRGGTDRMPTSVGIDGSIGELNAPTVFNSGFNFAQFWDGRAATLEAQAAGPIHNPIEMGSNWEEVLSKLSGDNGYQTAFTEIYPDGITPNNILDAIATFERSLVTANSRFDRFLRGDKDALSDDEREGYQRFKDYGCASCHQGINIGGNMFQRFGVVEGYFEGRVLSKADMGRYNVTGLEEDRHVFKVPSLRNVAVTAPYFHDGRTATLDKVVLNMGRYQLGRELSKEDVRLITAFLHSLTGQWKGKTLQ